jgi:hypothetical protein
MQLHLSLGIHHMNVSGGKQRMLRNAEIRDDPGFAISFSQCLKIW